MTENQRGDAPNCGAESHDVRGTFANSGSANPRALPYSIVQRLGWSYVVGEPAPEHAGPWRYADDAQDYADELNAASRNGRPA